MRDAPRDWRIYDARTEIEEERYDNEDGDKSYYMGSAADEDLFYGWIYTNNVSEENVLKNRISVDLAGFEVAYPSSVDTSSSFDIAVEPNSDHMVILRKTAKDFDLKFEVKTHSVE